MKALYRHFRRSPQAASQRLFRHLQVGSACFVALSHGLNDAQKSMGLITLALFAAQMIPTPDIPLWVILSCALIMGLGTASGGFRIIRTMGFSITKIDPPQGFAAETSASCVILAASFLGMPVSSSHMIAGSITGVGAARSLRSVNWRIPLRIGYAWALTLPGSALVAAAAYALASP
jgi:PiT family inorganic phosphate transporter